MSTRQERRRREREENKKIKKEIRGLPKDSRH
jgi:hypothetical protein